MHRASASHHLPNICFTSFTLLGLLARAHDDAVFSVSQLQTFNIPAPCRTVGELTTGAAISQALHQM